MRLAALVLAVAMSGCSFAFIRENRQPCASKWPVALDVGLALAEAAIAVAIYDVALNGPSGFDDNAALQWLAVGEGTQASAYALSALWGNLQVDRCRARHAAR